MVLAGGGGWASSGGPAAKPKSGHDGTSAGRFEGPATLAAGGMSSDASVVPRSYTRSPSSRMRANDSCSWRANGPGGSLVAAASNRNAATYRSMASIDIRLAAGAEVGGAWASRLPKVC